ncbi:hypothetical protein TEA_008506 [Camellia sinensis var. sinensis]|uniref:Dihydroflavonol 4-reductase n=1 Tax=Camellia sinensis var. sinensis TaxID=542762 RepID=A0A4S4EWM3_CAMSN|nr:hypothetical protein TEA_008506 [Camellia sinensis var. sinensis]
MEGGDDDDDKGIVCVTGGTGYVGSWLIMRLLQHGYTVRTTIRSYPDSNKDISYLTNLPGASEKLQIFNADLNHPETFAGVIRGCTGVFHVAHPVTFEENVPEEVTNERAINATLGILQACVNSKTVKRVVYTSSAFTVLYNDKNLGMIDESHWTDIDYVRAQKPFGASYIISKTLAERAALEFAKDHGLNLVSLIPPMIIGPYLCPHCPGSVYTALAVIFATQNMASSFRGLLTLFPDLNESTREITSAVASEPQPNTSGFAPLNFPMRSVEQKMAVQTDIEANQYI